MTDSLVASWRATAPPGRARLAGALLALGLTVAAYAAADLRKPRTTPELLVDVARGYALDHREEYTAADVQIVRAWLEAALKLEPSRSDAAVLLFELQSLTGDEAGAAATLAAIAQRDPTNEMAFARWVESTLPTLQTHEKRRTWLEGQLKSGRSSNSLALVRCRLAELALERLDEAEARSQLAAALAVAPDFPMAAELSVRLIPADAGPDERVRLALQYLRTHPGNIDAAWTTGDALQSAGFFHDAGYFYAHAQRLEAAQVGVLSADRFFRLSLNALGRREFADATTFAQAALIDASGGFQAALYLAWLLDRSPGDPRTASLRRRMAMDAAQIVDPEAWQPAVVAEVAWYYCTYDIQPQRALLLAESAAARLPSDRFALRVLAFALALNSRTDDAIPKLKALAAEDPFSAAKLAELLRAAGRDAEADAILSDLRSVPLVGPANEALRKAGYRFADAAAEPPAPASLTVPPVTQPATDEPVGADSAPPILDPAPASSQAAADSQPAALSTLPVESQPSLPVSIEKAIANLTAPAPVGAAPAMRHSAEKHPEIAALLAGFDRGVLEFDRDPRRLVQFTITYDRAMYSPAEPWWITIKLRNTAPFPITLGPDGLVNPLVLLSFRTEGDKPRSLPHLMQIALDRWRWLAPGAEVSIRQTLDIGPLRRISDRTPQQSLRVVASAILDPVMTQAGWRPGPGGQAVEPGAFVRLPVETGGPALHAIFTALSGDSAPAHIAALDVLCLLLAESQQARLGRLEYTPQPIPEERIRQAIHAALLSETWETRVRAMDSLQPAGIDAPTAALVKANLEHPHWLVRMMALRLLARQGQSLLPVAEKIAQTDAEPIVRALAAGYVARWTPAPPTTQPTAARPNAQPPSR